MRNLMFALLLLSTVLSAYTGKKIVVDLSTQEAIAYEKGREVMRGYVSTGRPGHRTPTGRFRVLEKELRHVSNKYPEPNGGARMDYMLRLTGSGIAMHLGFVPNYPASHGCIRMENGFAQRLYRWASVGTPVIVRGRPPRFVSRYAPKRRFRTTARRVRVVRASDTDRFTGNRPLKLLSSVPGKREAALNKTGHAVRKRASEARKEPPMTPLGMLRG